MPMLHVLWWAARSAESRSLFLRWLAGTKEPDELLIRYDPSLSATLDLALGQGLVHMDVNLVASLAKPGVALAAAVMADDSLLSTEKAFLAQTPSRISQKSIRELLEWQ